MCWRDTRSSFVCRACRVGAVRRLGSRVSLGDGLADVAMRLPVRLLAVAVAVVCCLAARASASCVLTRACGARFAGQRAVETFGAGHGAQRAEEVRAVERWWRRG